MDDGEGKDEDDGGVKVAGNNRVRSVAWNGKKDYGKDDVGRSIDEVEGCREIWYDTTQINDEWGKGY